jgi:RNA polymerase sigma-70 factor (ECF subfamily)
MNPAAIAWSPAAPADAARPKPVARAEKSQSAPADPELDAAMDRYASGDDRAFSRVHAGLYERIRAFLLRLCRSQATADDLLQETFLRIHRARGSFARGGRALPWAYAIARNAHIDFTRSAHTRRVRSLDAEDRGDAFEPVAPPSGDGEQNAVARQTARTVEAALAELPVAQREAFILIRYEGMSVEEAARILGVTENAVKLRAFHAYEALRAALGIEKHPSRASKSP